MLKRGTFQPKLFSLGSARVQRNFATLILSEHFEGKLNPTLGNVLKAASNFNDPAVDVLVHGDNTAA